jgi:hypothetical protein
VNLLPKAWVFATCLVAQILVGCDVDQGDPEAGSETHFLSWCSSDGSCKNGFECLCGVCAAPCAEASECSLLSEAAECVSPGLDSSTSCSESPSIGMCDLTCAANRDCEALGSKHRCDRGHCRSLADDCVTGLTASSEVVFLGDNFLAANGQLVKELENLANASGALGSGETYRDETSTLTTPFGGNLDLANQYAEAKAGGEISTLVLDAGGPDALLSCPEPATADCPALDNALGGMQSLLNTFESDGVVDVVYFFYPDPDDATLKAKFDVLRPLMQGVCDTSTIQCHFLDLRPTFSGHQGEYLMTGGILPTRAGSAAAAAAIWSLMQEQCVAQ